MCRARGKTECSLPIVCAYPRHVRIHVDILTRLVFTIHLGREKKKKKEEIRRIREEERRRMRAGVEPTKKTGSMKRAREARVVAAALKPYYSSSLERELAVPHACLSATMVTKRAGRSSFS